MLEGVQEDDEYQVSLSALYADGAQSDAVAVRYSTGESPRPTLALDTRGPAVSVCRLGRRPVRCARV